MHRRQVLAWLSGLALLAGCAWGLHVRWVLGDLPEAIGVRWVREVTVEPGFPTWLITDSAGYVLYEIDDATVESLQHGGLASLAEARVPRDAQADDPREARRHYLPWSASPLPAQWTAWTPEARGLWSGLAYARFSPEFERELLAAARSPGSFYTMNGHGDLLVVMPKLRLAVFSWWH